MSKNKVKTMEIPAMRVVSRDAKGRRILQAGTTFVDVKKRQDQITGGIAGILVRKVLNNDERKIDQRVFAIEIGVND